MGRKSNRGEGNGQKSDLFTLCHDLVMLKNGLEYSEKIIFGDLCMWGSVVVYGNFLVTVVEVSGRGCMKGFWDFSNRTIYKLIIGLIAFLYDSIVQYINF